MTLPERVIDVECFPNWFHIGVTDVATRTHCEFEAPFTPDARAALLNVLATSTVVTFNGMRYDAPMIAASLMGHPPAELKRMSDAIILGDLQPWQFYQQFGVTEPTFDHVDLFNVAPGQASLKIYGGRLHSRKLQDLPFDPNHMLAAADLPMGRQYCRNDRLTTIDMLNHLRPQLDLRVRVGQEYGGLDLRSKSDAQMAEAIMKHAAGWVDRPHYPVGTLVPYKAPPWVQFKTEGLRNALAIAEDNPFQVVEKEDQHGELKTSLQMAPALKQAVVVIARNAYQMGMGGLHSQETRCVQRADAGHVLSDFDVTSYYPSLILGLGIEPKQLAGVFRRTYREIVERRKAAKARMVEIEERIKQIEQQISGEAAARNAG